MKTKKLRNIIFFLLQTMAISLAVIFSVFPFSCKASATGLEIIGASYTFPTLNNYAVISSDKIQLEFDDKAKIVSASLTPFQAEVTNSDLHSETVVLSPALASLSDSSKIELSDIEMSEDEKTIFINLCDKTEIGRKYALYGLAEDKRGSTLTFSLSFTGYNEKIPHLVLTELQDGTSTKSGGEFIEFYALSDGNLSGLILKSLNDGDKSNFEFPSVEIKKGDYVTVHYRAVKPKKDDLDEKEYILKNCKNELKNIESSTALGSSKTSWDFWTDNVFSEKQNSVLGGTQDIITLENSNNGQILLALLYSIDKKEEWSDKFIEPANEMANINLWEPSGDFSDAFIFKTSAIIKMKNEALLEK